MLVDCAGGRVTQDPGRVRGTRVKARAVPHPREKFVRVTPGGGVPEAWDVSKYQFGRGDSAGVPA